METKTILKVGLAQFLVFTIILFMIFSQKENGDMTVVIFGTALYLPYVVFLTITNTSLIAVGLNYISKGRLKWISLFFTTAIMTVWYTVNAGQIEIYNWKIKQTEFIYFNIILCIINVATIYLMTNKSE